MKKITTPVAFILLCLGGGPDNAIKASTAKAPEIINKSDFINIISDMELLHSWLITAGESGTTASGDLPAHYYQNILASYEVDPYVFQESANYYLATSLEEALDIYTKVHGALEALLSA